MIGKCTYVNSLFVMLILLNLAFIQAKLKEPYEIELDIPDEFNDIVSRYGDIIELEDIDEELTQLYFEIILRKSLIGIKSDSYTEIHESHKINSELSKDTKQNISKYIYNNYRIHEENYIKYFIMNRAIGKFFGKLF